ncbi:MAG: hypothetical protein MZW92_53875 [Comamonadaceae bacterium]|nr:hypothetical protein [Comamonadaceae bacterium]
MRTYRAPRVPWVIVAGALLGPLVAARPAETSRSTEDLRVAPKPCRSPWTGRSCSRSVISGSATTRSLSEQDERVPRGRHEPVHERADAQRCRRAILVRHEGRTGPRPPWSRPSSRRIRAAEALRSPAWRVGRRGRTLGIDRPSRRTRSWSSGTPASRGRLHLAGEAQRCRRRREAGESSLSNGARDGRHHRRCVRGGRRRCRRPSRRAVTSSWRAARPLGGSAVLRRRPPDVAQGHGRLPAQRPRRRDEADAGARR